jgi:hypothetical protein
MDKWFILAFGGGVVLILAANLLFPRLCRKAYAGASDRLLVETKARARWGCWSSVAAQVLCAIAFVFAFAHTRDTGGLTLLFLFALLFCVALRSMFREMSIAAETELETRKLKEKHV